MLEEPALNVLTVKKELLSHFLNEFIVVQIVELV